MNTGRANVVVLVVALAAIGLGVQERLAHASSRVRVVYIAGNGPSSFACALVRSQDRDGLLADPALVEACRR